MDTLKALITKVCLPVSYSDKGLPIIVIRYFCLVRSCGTFFNVIESFNKFC